MTAEPESTEDGRYVVIKGRRWRATDPKIPEQRDAELRSILMDWRREVKRTSGAPEARAGVQATKAAPAASTADPRKNALRLNSRFP